MPCMAEQKRIFVVANLRHKPKTGEVLDEALPFLKSVADVVGVDKTCRGDLREIEADLVLVFGGDGTMLGVARNMHGNNTPVLGVNMGQLGFLAEVLPGDLRTILPHVLAGRCRVISRMMLKTSVYDEGDAAEPKTFVALNDAVLLRLPKAAMMTVDVSLSGEPVASYKGDGLLVSTATGSTGYSLSAGGPILSERLKAFIVLPICAHTLASRPIVLAGEETVEIVPRTRSGSTIEFVLDGQVSQTIPSGTRVVVEKAPAEFNIVSAGQKGRYEIIRDKLHWAGWVKEDRSTGSESG